jgi:ribosomal protein S18 acetylase RimI-like enzyme
MVGGLILAGQGYTIVPFDFADESMRKQVIAIVDKDPVVADLLNFTPEDTMEMYLAAPDEAFHTQLLVCQSDDGAGTVYGFIMCGMHEIFMYSKSVGFVNCIAVDKKYRGKGIAQALLQAFEDACVNAGISQLLLYVAKDNHKALRAYERYGFVIADDVRYSSSSDYGMTKQL